MISVRRSCRSKVFATVLGAGHDAGVTLVLHDREPTHKATGDSRELLSHNAPRPDGVLTCLMKVITS